MRNGGWRDKRLQVYLAGIPVGVTLFLVLGAIASEAAPVVHGPVAVLGLLGWLTWFVAGGMALAGRLSLRSAVKMSLAPYLIAAVTGLLALVL